MPFTISRRSALTLIGGLAPAMMMSRNAHAAAMTGTAVYPIAVPIYQAQFVAAGKGFFADAGLDCKLVQGGSGVKAREILASGNADVCIGDITHAMQLTNHGRPTRVLMPADVRNNALVFVIRKDLHDKGIDTLEKFAAWKRPDGRKPILGVSSLGGTTHIWAVRLFENMKVSTSAMTWIGAGNVDTMLGMLSSGQVDVLAAAQVLTNDAVAHGWGTPLFDGSSPENWKTYFGGKVPVTAHFALASTIDRDPARMQAFVTALWRATQWIGSHSPEEIYGAIEPWVGSTAKASNLSDIAVIKSATDYDGIIDAESYARGAPVWFSELTGIKQVALADVVEPRFVIEAKKAFPAPAQ